MSDEQKPAETPETKPMNDVAKAGESLPNDTTKAIITNRTVVQDPMVVEEAKPIQTKDDASSGSPAVPKTDKATNRIGMTLEPTAKDKAATPEVAVQETVQETASDLKPDQKAEAKADPKADFDAEAQKQAEHDANVQKIIDSKKYELPITTEEKKRSKRFVALGIVCAIILTLAWVDVALDAQLIKIPGVTPVTHIFSN